MPTVYLALLIPLIVTFVFYSYKKHEFTWWEFFLPIISVLVVIVISKAIIDQYSVRFTEYWGSTVSAVYEEEPYNYWEVETCSREVPCGTDSEGNTQYTTVYYDCSHQVDVAPSWWAITTIGENIKISDKLYDELVIQFKTKVRVINSHENYDPRDKCVGSRLTKFENKRVGKISYTYTSSWNGSDETRKAYTSQHSYVNKIKASDLTIFNISIVNEHQVDTLGLFRYPEHKKSSWFGLTNGFEYPTILGDNINKDIQENFRKLNGKFGNCNQLRLWVLIFENKPMSVAEYQKNYWVKGNKNELVICIGKRGDEIQWSESFSWAHSDIFTVEVKNKIVELYTYKDSIIKRDLPKVLPIGKKNKKRVFGDVGEKLPDIIPIPKQFNGDTIIRIKSQYPVLNDETWNELYIYLNENLHKFKRRSFKEFDYIRVEPSKNAVIFIYIFALVISIAVNIWVISNDINNKNNRYY